jgi:hypothetical protein
VDGADHADDFGGDGHSHGGASGVLAGSEVDADAFGVPKQLMRRGVR